MGKRVYIATLLMLITATSAIAQSSSEFDIRSQSRGMLLNRDLMSLAEMGSLSQSQFQFGSARSMAMAGAMTSLGGDATSMLINPAGLGMARSGSITFTPLVTIQGSETSNSIPYKDNDKNSFALSNFAAVINLYESGSSKLISLNLGLGYNKISDLNYGYSYSSMNSSSSLANLYSRQLTQSGVSLNELYGEDNPNWSSLSTNLWGAALGYKSGLTFQSYGDTPSGYNGSESIESSSTPIWQSTWISSDALVDQYMSVESEGSIGEYDIAVGGNISNKLYFGFTLGVQNVQQRLDIMYSEEYNNGASFSGSNELLYTNYNQTIITSGVGVNVKVGVTYRPIEDLRIGVAYHSPTYYSLNRQYQGSMASASLSSKGVSYAETDSPILEDFESNMWKYRSSSKLLIGGSYTILKRALLSVDYQYEGYGSMKVRGVPTGVSMDLYDNVGDVYQGVNTLRVGGEFKLTPALALRGGYGFSSSMLRDDVDISQLLDISATDRVSYFAAGVGYALNNRVSFDLTYMNYRTESSDYTLFYSEGSLSDLAPSAASAQSNSFSTKIKQQNIALSMVLKI